MNRTVLSISLAEVMQLGVIVLLALVAVVVHRPRVKAPPSMAIKGVEAATSDSSLPSFDLINQDGSVVTVYRLDLIQGYDAFAQGVAQWIDARPSIDYHKGTIPGSINVSIEDMTSGFPEQMVRVPENTPLIIYCSGGTCEASHIVTELMAMYGYRDISIMEAGFDEWQKAGYPVVAPGEEGGDESVQ